MVEIEGQVNDFDRVSTGLFSLDTLLADHLGNRGFPANTITELYGPAGIGKSTLAVYLAGALTRRLDGSRILIADLETAANKSHIQSNLEHSGFTGSAYMLPMIDAKHKYRSHEVVLEELLTGIKDSRVRVVILDSVGAIIPQAEMDNPLGASNMGRRGQLMAQFSRKGMYLLRVTEGKKFILLVNHQYDALGKIGQRVTPGGNAKTYAASLRITLYNKEKFDYGDTLIAVRLDKKRFGGVQRVERGYVYIVPDYGVSSTMSAVMDCVISGLATRKSSGVSLNGVNYGRLKILRDKVVAGDTEWVEPFIVALNTNGFVDEPEEFEETEDE